MSRFITVLCAALWVGGCGGTPSLPTGPAVSTGPSFVPSPPPAPPPSAPAREIAVDEVVAGTISQSHSADEFEVTAPADGTLIARLDWDVWYNGTLLLLTIQGVEFRGHRPDWSPIVGRLRVVGGERYRVTVALAGSDWIPDDRYVLTTALAVVVGA